MKTSYELPKEQHDEIYEKEIKSYYLPMSRAQEHPCAIITGGQPGSGKSGITDIATERFRNTGYVLVDADKLRPKHPDYKRLAKSGRNDAADVTHPDAGAWAQRLMRDGIDGRRNIIIDQTSRDPVGMEKIISELRKSGYRVEFHAMAVSAEVSEQRIHQRYEGQIAKDGYGRFSQPDKHDAAYSGLTRTVEAVEQKRLVDKLCLYDRNLTMIYENTLEQGRWKSRPTAAQTLEGERNRPMTVGEAKEYEQEWGKLVQQKNAPGRKATDEVKALAQARYKTAQEVHQSAVEMDAVVKKIHGQPLPGGLKGVVEPAGKKIPLEYRGKITHLTPHHALQQIGSNKYVLHARGKVAQDLQVGKSATISYMPGLSRGPEPERGKGLQR